MPDNVDVVAHYAHSREMCIRSRTILVEGTSDEALLTLAAQLELKVTGIDLLGPSLAVTAAGAGDRGGTSGVNRELTIFRGLAQTCLLPNGRPRYRFVGLFDNDSAGKYAIQVAQAADNSVMEYKDVFRLWPVMSQPSCMDPLGLKKTFERENALFKGLDWEIEDLLSSGFVSEFLCECPSALRNSKVIAGKVHREFTKDGKARLHSFTHKNAIHADLIGVVNLLKSFRGYLGLNMLQDNR